MGSTGPGDQREGELLQGRGQVGDGAAGPAGLRGQRDREHAQVGQVTPVRAGGRPSRLVRARLQAADERDRAGPLGPVTDRRLQGQLLIGVHAIGTWPSSTQRLTELEHVLAVGGQPLCSIAASLAWLGLTRTARLQESEGHGWHRREQVPPRAERASGDAELSSAAQRDRRKRILDATLALASKGGYDAVQMRTVAEQANVALGTLYRYFPSKIHLLVSALAREFERTQEKLDRGRSRATRRTSG